MQIYGSEPGEPEFMRRAGLPDAEQLLDRPEYVEWRGGRAHTYVAA